MGSHKFLVTMERFQNRNRSWELTDEQIRSTLPFSAAQQEIRNPFASSRVSPSRGRVYQAQSEFKLAQSRVSAMRTDRSIKWLSVCLLLLLSTQTVRANEPAANADSLISRLPQGAIGTVEVAKLAPLIERIETSDLLKSVLESPQWQEAQKQDQVQKALAGKAIAEGQLGMNLWQFAKTFFGDRIILGVYPPSNGGQQPDGVVIIRVKEAAALDQLWKRLSPLLPLAGDKLKVSDQEGGGRLIALNDGHLLVIRDRWIVLTKVKSLLDQTLQNLATTPATGGLADVAAWKQMTAQMGSDHEVQLCLNMGEFSRLAGHRFLPSKLDNGLVSLLLGGYIELAANSPYVGSVIDVRNNQVAWRTCVAGDPQHFDPAHKPFVLDAAAPVAALPPVNGLLHGFSLTRDFAGWYRNRESLLEAKLMPGFDKFETGLATFLPGRDFGEEVLPLLGQRLTIVSAPQNYAHLKGKPGVQLPGFALLLDLAKPAEANDLLSLVFQTVIGISNLQAMQEGRQPFVMSSESYKNTQIAFARYLKQPEGATLPISANFQPASARVGNRFVMTTNVEMCRQLIDTLQGDAAVQTAPANGEANADRAAGARDLYFDLSPSVAADMLEANAAVLHAQSLQQGKSTEQATNELNALLKLLRQLTPVSFKSTRHTDRWELELQLGWK